jgi:hypothetical protein
MPAALIAPARAELWQGEVPPSRLHAQCRGIAIRAAIPLRQQVEEEHCGENGPENKKSADDEDTQYGFQHCLTLLQPLLHFHPRLDVRDIVFNSLDDDLGSGGECSVVEAACAQHAMVGSNVKGHLTVNTVTD